jgi:hypothetical protein
MATSNSGGSSPLSYDQNLWFGDFTVFSSSPGVTYGSPVYIHQETGQSAEDYNYDYMAGGSGNLNAQEFRGTEETFLGWFTFRAYSRYLDIKTNINSSSYMFFFRTTGYLYNDGIYNSAMISGYSYINNSVINVHTSVPSGSRGYASVYRSSDGYLCIKLDKVNTGYTEGQVAVFFGQHGPASNGVRVLRYVQNDNSQNYY